MSDLEYGLEGLKLVAAFAALLWAYTVPYYRGATEDWRQELFSVRNALWDRARAAGGLDSPAHKEFRDHLNTLIRCAPAVNLWRLLMPIPRRPASVPEPPSLREIAASEPDPALAAALRDAVRATDWLLVRRLMLDTLPGAAVGIPAAGLYLALRRCKPLVGRVGSWASRMIAGTRRQMVCLAEQAGGRAAAAERADHYAEAAC